MPTKFINGTDGKDNLAPDDKVWENSDVSSYNDEYNIQGGLGADAIAGGAGADMLDGGEESDLRIDGRDYSPDGELIVDRVFYIDSPGGIYADFESNVVFNDGFGSIDQVYNFERVYGSYYDDVVQLSNDIYRGYTPLYGNDQVTGPSSYDAINGSYLGYWNLDNASSGRESTASSDVNNAHIIADLEAGTVDKFIYGGQFDSGAQPGGHYTDTFSGYIEGIVGSRGDDFLFGYASNEQDYIYMEGNAVVPYNWLIGNHGDDFIYQGGTGNASLAGGRNDDILVATNFNASGEKFVEMSGDGTRGANWPNYDDSDSDTFIIIGGSQRVEIDDFDKDDKLFLDMMYFGSVESTSYDVKSDTTEFFFDTHSSLKIDGFRELTLSAYEGLAFDLLNDNQQSELLNNNPSVKMGLTTSINEAIVSNAEIDSESLGGAIDEVTILGSDSDLFLGSGLRDFIRTGGGADEIHSGGGDDLVRVDATNEVDTVIVDTGSGDDRVVVDRDFQGTLLLKDSGGKDELHIDRSIQGLGVINGDDFEITLADGAKIEISNQFTLDESSGKYVVSEQGFDVLNFKGLNSYDGGYPGKVWKGLTGTDQGDALSTSPSTPDLMDMNPHEFYGDKYVNFLSGRGGDDILSSGSGVNKIFGGAGDDKFIISDVAQRTTIVGDTSTEPYIQGEVDFPELSTPITQNSSYADVVEIAWGYEESTIEQVAHGYRITNSVLDAVVEVFDVEVLKFATGDTDNPWDIKYLTAGAPVGKDNWMNGHDGKDIAYGDGSDVRFVLGDGTAPEGAAASSNGTSDILQVYANVTTVTQESYTYYQKGKVIRTTYARGYAKKTGTRDVEITEEALIWEGDRTAVDAFNFSDGVSINVINVADTTWSGEPIDSTIGTEGIDIIFGNDTDNLIDGKGGDDIIFGGGGDDVIIGGEGDDILVGGAGDDTIRGDMVDEMDAAREYFANLDSFDTNTLSIETSTVVEGNDVILGGDGVDDIESGEGKNIVASGRADMDGDGEADLDTIKEHMTTNKDIFDDDDWI